MAWEVFIEDNEATFRREFGIRDDDTGESKVFAWITYEALYGPGGEETRGSQVFLDWCLRVVEQCAIEADWKDRHSHNT